MTTILSFKAVTGEEIVAEVTSKQFGPANTIEAYVLRRPQVLQFRPVGNGQMGLAFVPWLLSNPELESVTIPSTAFAFTFETAAEVERQYITQMSGIQIANTMPN